MEVRFYQKSNRNEKAFMHHFKKYQEIQEKYADDQRDLADDLEIYDAFEEQDSIYIQNLNET